MSDNPHLTDEQRDQLRYVDGWQGTPSAEGTRRKLILDTISAKTARLRSGHGGKLSSGSALDFADAIVLALLGSGDDKREADAQEAINAVGEALDQIDAPQGATYAERIDRLYRELTGRAPGYGRQRPEGKVPAGTTELHVVCKQNDDHSPLIFIELEDQRRRSLGGFEWHEEDEYCYLAIPYGRDDAWVSEVAYQAAGAATRPLMEDIARIVRIVGKYDKEYPFPSERVSTAVAYLLSTFGIPKVCTDRAEEQLEFGRKEAAPTAAEAAGQVWPEESPQRRLIEGRFPEDDWPTEESQEDRLLRQREEARVGESRCAEERDCAFALLRWLLPVTVAKRID